MLVALGKVGGEERGHSRSISLAFRHPSSFLPVFNELKTTAIFANAETDEPVSRLCERYLAACSRGRMQRGGMTLCA